MAAAAKKHEAELHKSVDAYGPRIQKTELLMAREKREDRILLPGISHRSLRAYPSRQLMGDLRSDGADT
jgi:hypothetical protein